MDTHTRIKARRQELHLTVEELAEKAGVSRASMFRYETVHIQRAPVGTIEALAAALECSPAYLMGWTDDPNYQYIDTKGATHIEVADELIDFPPINEPEGMVTHIRIKERRTMLNISLSSLAKRLGVHRKTMYRYETPEVGSAPITVVEELAIALRCAPAYLMGWTDDPNYRYPRDAQPVEVEPETPEEHLQGIFAGLLEKAHGCDLENELYPVLESMMKSLLDITGQYEDVLDDYKDVPIVSEKISRGSIMKNAFRTAADPSLQQIDNDSRQLVAALGNKAAAAALSANADETISE